MGAPKGNQYAAGIGRPHASKYTDQELQELGSEMLSWMKLMDDTPNSELKKPIVHLSQWYSEIKRIPRSEWETIRQRESFVAYYEQALEWIGVRTLCNQNMAQSYGNRFLSLYFKDVKQEEREKIEHQVDYEIEKKSRFEAMRSVPVNDSQINDNLSLISANYLQKMKIDELEAKLNEFKRQANSFDLPSE